MNRLYNKRQSLLFVSDNSNNIFKYDLYQFDEERLCIKYKNKLKNDTYMCMGKIFKPIEITINGLKTNRKIYIHGIEESKYLAIIGIRENHYDTKFTIIDFSYISYVNEKNES